MVESTHNEGKVNLLNFGRPGLAQYFESIGERGYRAPQLVKWVHQLGVTDFDVMTNLSKSLRGRLRQDTEITAPKVVSEQRSADGTYKWLLAVDAGNCIETVFIPENNRGTLCVSSQVGCPLDCQFCATAKQGFNRNLTLHEIIGQVWLAARELDQTPRTPRRITNVVLMGMGEPLLNFDAVVAAMQLMMDDHAYNLGRKRITLSTAGVVPGIDKLSAECPVSLAISLHATNDPLRDRLVPVNRRYPLAQLLAACHRYSAATHNSDITFEYVMLKDVNDTQAEAKTLVALLRGLRAKVNLIPFNAFAACGFERSDDAVIDRFRDVLVGAGITTVTRKTRGDDISAACGQLVGKVQAKARRLRAAGSH